MLIGCS